MSSALTEAIAQQDLNHVEMLLSQGADPNATDDKGWRPLHLAIRLVEDEDTIDFVKLLLRYGANVNQELRRSKESAWDVLNDDTPILRACDPPNIAVARVLLEAGADPNAVRGDGESPLRLCVQAQDLDMVTLLLRYGAGKTINEYGGGGGLGLTALAYAARDFNIPMIELLLREGANPETLEEFGETARDKLPPREEHDPQTWDRVLEMLGRRRA